MGQNYHFVLIMISIVMGGCIGGNVLGNAVASIPKLFKSSANFSAAGDFVGTQLFLADHSVAYSMITPVGAMMLLELSPCIGFISQPAAIRGAASTRANHSLSGSGGDALIVPTCLSKPLRAAVNFSCSA